MGRTPGACRRACGSSLGCGSESCRSHRECCPARRASRDGSSMSAPRGGSHRERPAGELRDPLQASGSADQGASEQVAVQIQHYVRDEGLAPGDFLGREEDLAAEFGVSRPTLREALKLLSSGNLIRATKGPGGGIFVAHTAEQGMGRSLSDAIAMMLETESVSLHELLDARVLLEVPLAGLAAYQPEEQTLNRLRAAVDAAAANPDDVEVVASADAEIHQTIAAAAGNRMIQALTTWIFEVLQPSLV